MGHPDHSADASRRVGAGEIPQQLLFSTAEYRTRTEAVQNKMREAGLDALVVHQPENIAWLSGVWHDGFFAYHAVVIGQTGEPRLVMRALENPVAEELSWVTERHNYWDGENPYEFLAEAVRAVTTGPNTKIGVELDSPFLWIDRFNEVRRALDGHELVSSQRILERLQQIKSPQELAYIRQAGVIASAAVAAGIDAMAVGATEQDVAAAIAVAQAQNGHDGFLGGMGGTICTGWRTRQLHGQQFNRVIETGDRFRVELGGIYKQYWAKQERAGIIGGSDASAQRASDIVAAAQQDAIDRMGPGVPACEIAAACREPLLNSGLVERYDNRVGYGLGLQFHPTSGDFTLDIDARSDYELQAGMVFHMLLFAEGAAMSETVAITEDGHEVLTNNPRVFFTK